MGAVPSRTAVLVCQGRAVAAARSPGPSDDAFAAALLDPGEREEALAAASPQPPSGVRARLAYERLRAVADVVEARSAGIDAALVAPPPGQAVLLGAGLDTRPWRLGALAGADVLLLDEPVTLAERARRARRLPPPRVRRLASVAVDLARDDLLPALAAVGHRADRRTWWVWEGVVPYLPPAVVAQTAARIAVASAPGSRLVVAYEARSAPAAIGRLAGRAAGRLAGLGDPLADEPWRSRWRPDDLAALLRGVGFEPQSDRDLRDVALAHGLPAARRRTLAWSRLLVAVRAG